MLRDSKYYMPEPNPAVLHDLLPLLCTFAMDLEIDGKSAASLEALPAAEGTEAASTSSPLSGYGVDEAVVKKAMRAVSHSEVARKLAQVGWKEAQGLGSNQLTTFRAAAGGALLIL